jgi:hypothetical protein
VLNHRNHAGAYTPPPTHDSISPGLARTSKLETPTSPPPLRTPPLTSPHGNRRTRSRPMSLLSRRAPPPAASRHHRTTTASEPRYRLRLELAVKYSRCGGAPTFPSLFVYPPSPTPTSRRALAPSRAPPEIRRGSPMFPCTHSRRRKATLTAWARLTVPHVGPPSSTSLGHRLMGPALQRGHHASPHPYSTVPLTSGPSRVGAHPSSSTHRALTAYPCH